VREFERRNPNDDPEWIRYFDDVELNAEIAHCYRDLGRPDAAIQHATRGLVTPDGSSLNRGDFFVAVVLADSYLALGDVEQACATVRQALDVGEQLRSARCVGYLREFGKRLARVGDTTSVVEFNSAASQSRLWRIATRSSET
jgi:tetratricopeptide (TPR) repeat protein